MIRLRRFDNPFVEEVRGRPTAYVNSRRFLLPEHYRAGERLDPSAALPAADAATADKAKTVWLGIDLIGERTSNRVADTLKGLLPQRLNAPFMLTLLLVNLVCTALVLWVPMPLLAPLAWSGVEVALGVAAILLFHEFGHCAMARRLGIRVDGIGAGLYLIFPALFSRISLAGLLTWRERIDLFAAGAIFQMYLTPLLAGLHFATATTAAKQLFIVNLLLLVFNLVPVLHFDGYRIMRELMTHRFGPVTRQRWGVILRVITVAFVGWSAFALSTRAWRLAGDMVEYPGWRLAGDLGVCLAFLGLLAVVAPRWIRRPYG